MPTATTISVVLETDSTHPYDNIKIGDCLEAVARQTYPRELTELIVVDGGKVEGLEEVVKPLFPSAIIFKLPGGTKFEMKNLGMKAATGEIVAFVDGDCAPPPDWLSWVVRELAQALPEVAGVQGITVLTDGFLAREISALFYGVRSDGSGRYTARLVTDNCAFRREIARRFTFEHTDFSTVVDTLFLRRLEQAGYRMRLCENLRMDHSFPGATWEGVRWFFARAYGVGYYMVKGRQLEPDLRGSWLVRWGGVGWPLLALGKFLLDLHQVWQNRRRLKVRPLVAFLPTVLYEAVLFLGGVAALLRFPPPRWS